MRHAASHWKSLEERCEALLARGGAAVAQLESVAAEMRQGASGPGDRSPLGSIEYAPSTPESRRERGNGWPRCTPSFGGACAAGGGLLFSPPPRPRAPDTGVESDWEGVVGPPAGLLGEGAGCHADR